jgi:sec-independent protein translocase protein TatA
MPFGLHLPELIIVLVVALLVFGPKKLPEMGSAIGKSIKEFRKGMNELNNPESKNSALKAPKDAVEEIRQPLTAEPVASTVVSESESNIEKPLD